MGKLKNHLIGLEDEFWAEANSIIGSCANAGDFIDTMLEHRDKLPLETEEDIVCLLEDAWYDKWSNYQ